MDYQPYIENAIQWADEQLGSSAYRFLCLAFVEDAYEKGNEIEIFGGSTAKESADQYGLQTSPSTPPRGAFVFYDCTGQIDGVEKTGVMSAYRAEMGLLSMDGIKCGKMIVWQLSICREHQVGQTRNILAGHP